MGISKPGAGRLLVDVGPLQAKRFVSPHAGHKQEANETLEALRWCLPVSVHETPGALLGRTLGTVALSLRAQGLSPFQIDFGQQMNKRAHVRVSVLSASGFQELLLLRSRYMARVSQRPRGDAP